MLKVQIETIDDGVVHLKLEGHMSSVQHGFRLDTIRSKQQVTLQGECKCDAKTGQLQSLAIVGSGSIRWHEAPQDPVLFDSLIEWQANCQMVDQMVD